MISEETWRKFNWFSRATLEEVAGYILARENGLQELRDMHIALEVDGNTGCLNNAYFAWAKIDHATKWIGIPLMGNSHSMRGRMTCTISLGGEDGPWFDADLDGNLTPTTDPSER